MNPANWKNIKQILSATLDLPEAERHDFLARETDDSIRQEVEKLLAAHEKAEDFIEKPFAEEYGLSENGFEEKLIGKRIDDYLILEKIGEGGMGTVFLAEHTEEEFSQKVALKLIKRGMDTNAVLKRFLMERQILSQLEHPHIARLLDGGSTKDGLPYFVMEYVSGENIREFCENHQFDTNERLEIFQKVCQAIGYAHQKLIVHRDIKPSNIIVTEDGTPKLLDFGIAKLLSPDWNYSTTDATATNFRLMTPEYASPEQLRGKMTTVSTDIYSLGVVLYELLTGTRPFNFKSKNPIEAAEEILTQEPICPSSAISRSSQTNKNKGQMTNDEGQKTNPKSEIQNPKSLKGDLDNIILKAIRKELENRYQSVAEFCDDIHRYLTGLPVKATADSRFYRIQKFVGRHRTGVLTASLVALLLMISTAVTTRQYFIANSERAKSENSFRQLRDVAKSLLNETNEALAKLPESIEARQTIIEKSVAVLDSLATDETKDAEFLSELADAYEKLGGLRNWNLRNAEIALSDFQKALNLREKVLEIAPNNIEYRNKLNSTLVALSEFYTILGDTEKVIENFQKLDENNRRRIEIEPDNPQFYYEMSNNAETLSGHFKTAGRESESQAFFATSFEMIERAVNLQQSKVQTPENQERTSFYLMHKAALSEKSEKSDEALSIYQTAAEIADRSYAADKTQKFSFNHSVRIRRLMADIYKSRGDWQKALEMYDFCLEKLRDNAGNKNLDVNQMPMSIAIYTMRCGVALDRIGEKTLEKGLTLYRQYLDGKKNDTGSLFYAPEFLTIPADFYVSIKQKRQAANVWQEYAERLEPFLQKSPNDGGILRYSAGAIEKKGDILGGFANDSFAETNKLLLKEARENYEKSLAQLRKIGETSAEIEKRIEGLERKISLLSF